LRPENHEGGPRTGPLRAWFTGRGGYFTI
jgi:hypothetical protein